MNLDKYETAITLVCPTCTSTKFEFDENLKQDDASPSYKCVSCENIISKNDLMQSNSENIEEHQKEIGKKIAAEIAEDLKKSLKKAFRGNSFIKIK